MAAIFENRKIEKNDLTRDKLKFPADAILTNLHKSFAWGESEKLQVKDDQGNTHSLTIKNDNGEICFTNGWKNFAKGIQVGDEISLYKEDDYVSSGAPQYRIKVTKA